MRSCLAAVTFILLAARAGAQTAPPQQAFEGSDAAKADLSVVIESLTLDELGVLLNGAGWSVAPMQGQDMALEASFADDISGTTQTCGVWLYNCEEGRCREYAFTMAMTSDKPVTVRMVNSYNLAAIIGSAYLLNDGRVGLSYGGSLRGGVTKGHFIENVRWWQSLQVNFVSTLEERTKPAQ
jgi:hypothetical protein